MSDGTLRVAGEIEAGEAIPVGSAIAVRQRGSSTGYYLTLFGCVCAGLAAGWCAAWLLNTLTDAEVDSSIAAVIGASGGAALYTVLARRLLVRRFRASMAERDLVTRRPHAVVLSPDGLRLESGGVRREADWEVVTELFRVKAYWVFMVEMEPWIVPARFFAHAQAERDFVDTALARLTLAARSRSARAASG